MAVRNIVKDGDELLLKTSRPVERFDSRLAILLDDMYETMKDNGVGLAAPQVGILRRAIVIDVGEGPIDLVNPVILEKRGEQQHIEGCLSCPGLWGVTRRPAYVKVKAYDRNGKEIEIEGRELLAVALCHEIDHLDGILFKKHVLHYLDEKELEEEQNNRSKRNG